MSLLRSSYAVFLDYQRAVLGSPDLSPIDLLCGRRMQGVIVGRARGLCGWGDAPARSAASRRSLRFRKGTAIRINARSSALAAARRLACPLARRPALAALSRLSSGGRSRPASSRVPPRGGRLSAALRHGSRYAEALLRLDVWRGKATPSSRSRRRGARLLRR